MSDFVYPKCPDCGRKAAEGEGVSLYEVTQSSFIWKCSKCGSVKRGRFGLHSTEVDWLGDASLLDRVRRVVLP